MALSGMFTDGSQNTALLYNPVKFSGYLTGAQNVGTADTLVQYNNENFDTSSNFDTASSKGRFTAPFAGFYQFNAVANVTTAGTGIGLSINFYKNGALVSGPSKEPSIGSGTDPGVAISAFLQLAINDYVEVYCGTVTAAKALVVSNNFANTFSGFLVSLT